MTAYLFTQRCTRYVRLEVEADSAEDAWEIYTTPGEMFPIVDEDEEECETLSDSECAEIWGERDAS